MTETMTGPSTTDRELLITRDFDASREQVFKAWTEPEQLVEWWGPKGFTTPLLSMDVTPGGSWRTCIRSPEGVDYVMYGVYREIDEPDRLVFTFGWEEDDGTAPETLVTVTFEDHDGRTRMTFHQAVFTSVGERDDHQAGWAECFEGLTIHLEGTGRSS